MKGWLCFACLVLAAGFMTVAAGGFSAFVGPWVAFGIAVVFWVLAGLLWFDLSWRYEAELLAKKQGHAEEQGHAN